MRHTRRCQAAVYVFAAFAVVVPFLAGGISMSAGCPDAFSIFLVLSLSVMGIVCIFKYGSAATALVDSAVARGGKYSRDRQLDRIAFIHSADSLRAFLGDRGYTVQAVPTE